MNRYQKRCLIIAKKVNSKINKTRLTFGMNKVDEYKCYKIVKRELSNYKVDNILKEHTQFVVPDRYTERVLEDIEREEGSYLCFTYKGYACKIVRNVDGRKFWCGYVQIPKNEKVYDLTCHGGITYRKTIGDYKIVGFDCGHAFDYSYMKLPAPISRLLAEMTNQYTPDEFLIDRYRNKKYVIENCKGMIDEHIENMNK